MSNSITLFLWLIPLPFNGWRHGLKPRHKAKQHRKPKGSEYIIKTLDFRMQLV